MATSAAANICLVILFRRVPLPAPNSGSIPSPIARASRPAGRTAYNTVLRPVPQRDTTRRARLARPASRVFLNLRTGLLLPKYALMTRNAPVPANQVLVDLVALSRNGSSVSFHSPSSDSVVLNGLRWPASNRRTTTLKSTRLNQNDFANTATVAAFEAVFAGGTNFPDAATTGPLAKNQVIAFQIEDAANATYTGLLLVSNVVLGTLPTVSCTVKVQKAP
jgi:hypothetical protein